ncbi:CoA ester lyase, partial [Micrococcus luteus]|nr:CoA ester lyase [Micrococcus luteus]
RVLAAAEGRHGAFELDGAMVDEVVLAQARAVLRRADAPRPASA